MEVVFSPEKGQGVVQQGVDLEIGQKPLHMEIDGGNGNEGTTSAMKSSGRKELAMVAEQTLLEKFTALVSFAAFASSIASMIMVGGTIVKTASVLIILLSPYSYFQQTRITDIRALKETYLTLKQEVNQLAVENDNLKEQVGRLDKSVGKLEDIENVMSAITETEGQSVDSLRATVEENVQNVERMEKNIRANVLQNILSVVFSCDGNGDYNLSDKETTMLIKSLRDVNGVNVNEKKFRKIVQDKNGSVEGVVEILRNLLDEDSNDNNAVFSFEEQ